MLANSWLYHYYSVHTKIQFGLPYEGTARVPPTTSYYHHSPTLPGSLAHPYHLTYGFASAGGMPPHQGSPGLLNHHNGSSTTHHGSNASSEHFRSHSYRIDPLQPIDYSQTTPLNIQIDSRYGSNKGNSTSGNPLKRKAIARLEPLYIPGSKSIIDVSTVELHSQHASDGSTVLLTTVIPTRHRFYTKMMPVDSTEYMDQWNPSPPWSESAQKVPDIIQQDLSPYLTTTPPTPTSAPLQPNTNHGPAFSFDWMPEQFVPVINNSSATQHDSVHCQSTPNWSTNRLISMDRRSSDDDTRSE